MATQTQERRLAFLATALPPIVWVVVFFLAPLAIVWAYSFGQNAGLTEVDISGTFANYVRALQPLYLGIFAKSIFVAGLTTLLCLIIGFPVALAIVFASERWRPWMLLLVMLPFWTNLLDPHLRADRGAAHRGLRQFHARMAVEQRELAHDAGGLAAASASSRRCSCSTTILPWCSGSSTCICRSWCCRSMPRSTGSTSL